jgi:hypothetical protein
VAYRNRQPVEVVDVEFKEYFEHGLFPAEPKCAFTTYTHLAVARNKTQINHATEIRTAMARSDLQAFYPH